MPPISRLLGFTAPWFPAQALSYETANDRRGPIIFKGKLLDFPYSHANLPMIRKPLILCSCVCFVAHTANTNGRMDVRPDRLELSFCSNKTLGCFLISSCERGRFAVFAFFVVLRTAVVRRCLLSAIIAPRWRAVALCSRLPHVSSLFAVLHIKICS